MTSAIARGFTPNVGHLNEGGVVVSFEILLIPFESCDVTGRKLCAGKAKLALILCCLIQPQRNTQ